MKITIFTSNNSRHNYFINLMSKIASELFVLQECGTIFPGLVPGYYPQSKLMVEYFSKVQSAQKKIFQDQHINTKSKVVHLLTMQMGDLNKCSMKLLNNFLKSDIFVVFGASYIKGDLVNFLVENKALNIHMGLSPYYRGCDCNFWALFDGNPHLVGSTVHYLSPGLDSGPILYHAISEQIANPYEYTMSTVKSAFHSLKIKIQNGSIFNYGESIQDKSREIRYSKKNEFNDAVLKEYFGKTIKTHKEFDLSLLKDPFLLKEKYFYDLDPPDED
jgi:folate-dependent phosphoribosylglycinamide formyltransferase PurN